MKLQHSSFIENVESDRKSKNEQFGGRPSIGDKTGSPLNLSLIQRQIRLSFAWYGCKCISLFTCLFIAAGPVGVERKPPESYDIPQGRRLCVHHVGAGVDARRTCWSTGVAVACRLTLQSLVSGYSMSWFPNLFIYGNYRYVLIFIVL